MHLFRDELTQKTNVLQQIKNYDKIPFFSFDGNKDICLVSKCYDGDTCHIVRVIDNIPYRFKCRLLGIDTAEMKSTDEKEKAFAIETKKYLENLILHKLVFIEFKDFDKYGRLLCNLYLNEYDMNHCSCSVNQLLIENGYAQSYDGGTKVEFKDWPKRDIMNKMDKRDIIMNVDKSGKIVKKRKWFCGLF